jgi:hypothetical protein
MEVAKSAYRHLSPDAIDAGRNQAWQEFYEDSSGTSAKTEKNSKEPP